MNVSEALNENYGECIHCPRTCLCLFMCGCVVCGCHVSVLVLERDVVCGCSNARVNICVYL